MADFVLSAPLAGPDFNLGSPSPGGPCFDLRDSLPASLDFRFGEGQEPSAQEVSGSLSVVVAGAAVAAGAVGVVGTAVAAQDLAWTSAGRTGARGPLSGACPHAAPDMAGEWDPNAYRGPRDALDVRYHAATRTRPPRIRERWEYGIRTRPTVVERWQPGRPESAGVGAPFDFLVRARPGSDVAWSDGSHLGRATAVPYVMAWRRHLRRAERWAEGTGTGGCWCFPYVMAWRRHTCRRLVHGPTTCVSARWVAPWIIPARRPYGPPQWRIPWQAAGRPVFVWPPPAPPEPPGPEPIEPSTDLVLACRMPLWTPVGAEFYFGAEPCSAVVFLRGGGPSVPGVVIVIHTLSIVTLPDGTPIPCDQITVSTDLDSWGWRWAAVAQGAADDLVEDQREVQVSIDEWSWKGITESLDLTREFGRTTSRIGGRSLSAYLAEPYTEPRSRTEDNARTAVQLAEDELYGTGWTLDWRTVDWLVSGGAYSYDSLTPIGAVKRIAEAVGAVVLSHRTDTVLIVLPRYPVSPWALAAAQPDVKIPEHLILRQSTRWDPRTLYRGVWVYGRSQGVGVRVYREGTDGSPYARMVVDPLITEVAAGRERGRIILSGGGKKSVVTLTLPLTQDVGLVEPGDVVRVANDWTGYAVGVTVAASLGRVLQSVEIERPHEAP